MRHVVVTLRVAWRCTARRLTGVLLGALLVGLLLGLQPAAVQAAAGEAPVDPAVLARAVDQMEQLDRLRISLASSLEGSSEEPTMDTMREVCMPVGKRAMAIGLENGWTVRQVASRYRNPDHAPAGAQDTGVIDLFARHPEITGLWEPASPDQGAGVNYYRRIDVQPSCLACHGSKDSRPAFVKERYADDRAFDFRPGDLRGMYAVFIPELQEALQQAG
ncbi:MAG: DUF3365 domain-containing protein [Cyanobium sp. Prado107]|jgi:hypothetical protein|nr:DUF3365 domain-containing protein [Cyanobium sp. Prado107]